MNLRDNSPDARRRRTIALAAALLGITVVFFSLPKDWFELPDESETPRAPINQGLAELEAAARSKPLDVQLQSKLAVALSAAGRHEDAERCFKTALRLAPQAPLAYHNYAVFLTNRGRHAQAEEMYARELEVSPADGRAHYLHGAVLQSMRRIPEAAAEYEAASKLSPNMPDSYLALAALLTEKRPVEEIKQYVEKYLELKGTNVGLAQHALSRAYRTKQAYQEALAAARTAVKAEPNSYPYMRNLGQLYAVMNRFDDADRVLRQAAQLARDPSPVYIEIGVNLQKAGRFPQSIEAFRKALEISPETGNVHQYIARSYQRMGDLTAAARAEAEFRAWERKRAELANAQHAAQPDKHEKPER
jgi:tetratricopeptide (TPR) repeat protein